MCGKAKWTKIMEWQELKSFISSNFSVNILKKKKIFQRNPNGRKYFPTDFQYCNGYQKNKPFSHDIAKADIDY